jgi:DNA-binding CsgD family transcriptional regulator
MGTATDRSIIGREGELTRLDELVRLVADGQGGLAWVQGEPGVGKSALVDAAVARASVAGCSVLRGAGDELTQAFPLRLMADSLGALRRSPDLDEVARLLRGEGSGAVDPVLAASERLLELVDRLCADGPVVLVTEDLQWADEESLLVWNRLARAVDQIPLLLVGTCHPVPYRATVARLRSLVRERGQLLELGPLGEADVHRIAARLLEVEPGPLLRAELARAGGNPLYVQELVNALVRDGLVEVTGGAAEFRGESGAVPGSLAVAIERRLRFPSASTADVLRIAALLGNDFDLDELAIATGRPVVDLAGGVEEAIAAGAVYAIGPRLAFRHELIRQVLVEQSSTATRAGLHSHLARQLATAGRGVDVVARHLLAVPRPTDGWVARWLAEIPDAALHAVPQAAAELLLRVVRSVDGPLWEVLAARAAQVLFWLGRDDQASRMAEEVARRSDNVELAARMNILLLRSLGRAGRVAEALAVANAPVDDRVTPACRATLGAWSAVMQVGVGNVEQAGATAVAALHQAVRSGDPLAVGYAMHASTLVSDAPSALVRIDQALAGLGEDPESVDLRMLLINNRLTYLAVLGRWDDVEAALPPALVLAERVGTFRAASLLGTAAEVCYLRGTWDDAVVHLGGIDADFLGTTSNLNASALGALIALHRGDREKADACLEGLTEPSTAALARHPMNWRLTAAWALRAEVAGDPRRALALMATWLDPVPVPGQRTRQEVMPHLVRLALAVHDPDTALAAVRVCRADAEADAQVDRVIAARCCQALLDDDADGLLAAAADYHRHGWPLQRGLALEEAAVRLAQVGDTARARVAFTEALNAYADLGADWDLRRTEARLRPHGIRRGSRSVRRRATSGWDALTPAETRIAGLVAQGLSNPDIAGELFLSRRTVQTHVSNILGKLGLSSRLQIIREAAEQ